MSDNILAPIQILDMFLTDIRFHIEQSPAKDMTLHIQEHHEASDVQAADDGSAYKLNMDLTVAANLSNVDDADDIRAHAQASVHISIAVPLDIDDAKVDRKAYLEANAISIAYGHARSCIMTLAGLSPMHQPFILPAVLPYNMIGEDQD